jgi:hypothetical protein
MSEMNPEAQVARIEADPAKPWKAIVGSAIAAVLAFLIYWKADPGDFTGDDVVGALIAALSTLVPVFGGTYLTRNPLRSKRMR